MDEIPRPLEFAAEDAPADTVAAGAIDLRQPGKSQANGFVDQRRKRDKLRVVVCHLVVNFVRQYDQAVALRQCDHGIERRTIVDRAARVVRVNDNDRPGSARDLALDIVQIRHEAVVDVTGIMQNLATIERRRSRP